MKFSISVRLIALFTITILLISSCGDEQGPIGVDSDPEIQQKKEVALEKAEQILTNELLLSLENEIDNQSESLKKAYLDTLNLTLEQLIDTVSKYHSVSDLKSEIQRIDQEAQKLISTEFGNSKTKAFKNLGLGYGKGTSIDTGVETNVAVGIANGFSAQGGGGSEILYDFVNMDREVYIFTACGIEASLVGVGVGASLSANIGLSGYKKWLLNIIQEPQSNKFEGPAKASSFGLSASGFGKLAGLDGSFSIGKAQDVEGSASFYNLTECPSYFDAEPLANGLKEIFFEVSVGAGVGVGGELIAAIEAGQIGSNRTGVAGSYNDYDNRFESRKVASFKMASEILTNSPISGLTTGIPDGFDITASALAIFYGGIEPSEFDQAEPALSFSPEVFTTPSVEGSYQLSISNIGTGELDWEITAPNAEWVSVEPTSGTGNTVIDIVIAENFTGEDRTAELSISSNGGNSGAIPITQEKASSSNDLIVSYPFNGNAQDASGNGNDGTVNGAIFTEDRFGNANTALSFDGDNDYLTAPDLDQNQPLTLSFWINSELSKPGHVYNSDYWDAYWADYYGISLTIHTDGAVGVNFGDGSYPGRYYLSDSGSLKPNQWHHIVAIWREGGTAELYIDKQKQELNPTGNQGLTIAKNRTGDYGTEEFFKDNYITGENYLKGIFDDLKIYNYELPEAEVEKLYSENGWTGNSDNLSDWPQDTETVVVEVTNPVTGRTWMDRNLGASRAATSPTDEQAYGDLYQWGRAADGHQKRSSNVRSNLSSTDLPGHGDFIVSTSAYKYDWRSPQNDNLWQGINGENNPCPMGYRLPTESEWLTESESWDSKDVSGAFNSPLKLVLGGARDFINGSVNEVDKVAVYWSSTLNVYDSRYFAVEGNYVGTGQAPRAVGYSVRCIKD